MATASAARPFSIAPCINSLFTTRSRNPWYLPAAASRRFLPQWVLRPLAVRHESVSMNSRIRGLRYRAFGRPRCAGSRASGMNPHSGGSFWNEPSPFCSSSWSYRSRACSISGIWLTVQSRSASIGARMVLPIGATRYSTATGRERNTLRSMTPFRSSRRSVLVKDFWLTPGTARRSSLNRLGDSQSWLKTCKDHLSKTWSSSSRWEADMPSGDSEVSSIAPSFVAVAFVDQV